jgi:hypothetical protein
VRYDGSEDGTIRVMSGLKPGDVVAISNIGALTDGAPVLPVEASESDDGASAY